MIKVKSHSKVVDYNRVIQYLNPFCWVKQIVLDYTPVGVIRCPSAEGGDHPQDGDRTICGSKCDYIYVTNPEMLSEARAEYNHNRSIHDGRYIDVILTLKPLWFGYEIVKCDRDNDPCSYAYK